MSIIKSALLLGTLVAVPSVLHAQTAAGSTPGSFRVTESGAAEYRIPIRVPPGIAGMEPKLALVYNSQAGNGMLGVGWSLEGLSAVTRCPRTMAQDGVRGGVNYDWNDRYCLDGQRLIAIAGSYDANGTEYRTERESFSRVISYDVAGNGPAWFKVWTKSGQIIEYGNTPDSRIEAQGKPTVRIWAVNKVSDTKGNYFTLAYSEDSGDGDYRPARIDYGGNTNAGSAAFQSIRFAYEPRADMAPAYIAGSVLKVVKRLTSVKSHVGETLSRAYRLAYDNNGPMSRTRALWITECTGDGGICLPATTLSWRGSADQLTHTSHAYASASNYDSAWLIGAGDFNGDGRSDFLRIHPVLGTYAFLSNGNGAFDVVGQGYPWPGDYGTGESGWLMRTGDFNGDGLTDFIRVHPMLGTHTFLSNGNGMFDVIGQGYSSPGDYGSGESDWLMMTGDFNGDGWNDFIRIHPSVGTHIFFSRGDGTFQLAGQGYSSGSNYDSAWLAIEGDFSGNGKSGFLRIHATLGIHIFAVPGNARDALISIANGAGFLTSIEYRPLTESLVHTKDTGASYPLVDLQSAMNVVSAVSVSDGVAGVQTSVQRYGGAKADHGGRGFLGFRWTESTNQSSGLNARTEYRQDWPYVGFPSLLKTTQSSGARLRELSNTYSCINPSSGTVCAVSAGNRYFPFVSQSIETGNDLNGAALPTVTTTTQYDSFGNATSVAVSTGDGYSKSTTSIYNNDVPNWLLGRLKSSTVQSTLPAP